MSIKDMLLTEASPLPYSAVKATVTSSTNDIWTFTVAGKTLGVKANSLRTSGLTAYRKSKLPSVFHMFSIDASGKTSKTVKMIPQAPNVIATVAEIIANETHDNKLNDVVIFRVPASMGRAETVSSLIARYIKKSAVPFEQKGVVNVGEKGFNYVFMTRKGKSPTVAEVFGIKDEDVQSLTLDQIDANETAVEEIVSKIEPKIKLAVPSKVKFSEIVASAPANDRVIDFEKKNPPIIRTFDATKRPEFKMSELYGLYYEPDNPIMGAKDLSQEFKAMARGGLMDAISLNSMADATEAREYALKIVEMGITMADFLRKTPKYEEVKRFVEEEVTGNEKEAINIMDAIFVSGIVEGVSVPITRSYQQYKPSMSTANKKAIEKYCGQGFTAMNEFLIEGGTSSSVANIIQELDLAFMEAGVRVDPKLTVYRGSQLKSEEASSAAKSKLFYFRSFVSTSLNPKVGFTFGGNDKAKIAKIMTAADRVESLEGKTMAHERVIAAFMINGLDSIPVLIPGAHSPFAAECEIILPRGTTIRINDMATAKVNPFDSGVSHIVFECSVVPHSEISINEVVYDGDEFAETGRLVEFTEFCRSSSIMTEAKKKSSKEQERMDAAVGFMTAVNSDAFTKRLTKKEKEEIERIAAKYCSRLI
ncbi:Alt RNA polymerase ADP-ribosylase [Aeromonas phage phiAS5]|uniref:Alt RNA polymerase ADP-ribosylase n=1 Tax=Aeromonas phage phiAS5 TaxID=879630 RepID=E1A2E2_9CAUD|nr:Alt-like RNA polymerase ADP-ribosyltransferase [Aeromonas phage phiAS5]ADM79888.1 Alt RNA polymerase ADP-ribosylase [Aeromonas phage phiAS5]